jgi:hypothetical protein
VSRIGALAEVTAKDPYGPCDQTKLQRLSAAPRAALQLP